MSNKISTEDLSTFKAMRAGVAVFFALGLLSACDDASLDDVPFNSVTVNSKTGSHSCSCPTRFYYLENHSDKKVSVTYQRHRRVSGISSHRDNGIRSFTKTLNPSSEYNLGCGNIGKSDATAGQINCDLEQNWTVRSVTSAFYKIQDIKVANTDMTILDLTSAPINCRKECLQPQSAEGYCETIPGTSIPSAKKQEVVKILSALSKNSDTTIEKMQLMKQFEVDSDPCERGDLFLKGGVLVNSGKHACSLDVNKVVGESTLFDLEFSFPVEMKGSLEYENGLTVTFGDLRNAPWIEFADDEINSEYGGMVLKMESVAPESMLIVSTENGCLGVGYD